MIPDGFVMTSDFLRELAAAILAAAYLAYCYCRYRHSASRHGGHMSSQPGVAEALAGGVDICLVYASQSGQAERLARASADSLTGAGCSVKVLRIDEDWTQEVARVRYALFIVSTFGEGGAPDHAAGFVRRFLKEGNQIPVLRSMPYGVLALGDASYPAFCAFGRRIDAWLQACGAVPLFRRVEVDRLDPVVLKVWFSQLKLLAGKDCPSGGSEDKQYAEWVLAEREYLNAGSPGSPISLIRLYPAFYGRFMEWQAGDLVDIKIPVGDGRPRVYSISNLPGDGCIELIVRRQVGADGKVGQTSGWLTESAPIGTKLSVRIRENPGFHLQQAMDTPLILIGSGAGIAGLRAHLKARACLLAGYEGRMPERDAWLFFGERSGRHDHLCRLEIDAWKASGVLSRVNIAFSRDDPVTPYVQDSLLVQGHEVAEWIAAGAQILICGNARKMAVGVDEALRRIIGTEQVDLLCEAGRIRRDIF